MALDVTLSWIAVRRGAIYCAPACGANCTWVAYQLAMKRAKALCKRLGPGWKPVVHENMGWHYKAIDKTTCWKVSPSIFRGRVEGYIAFLGERDSIGGTWAEHGKTPEAAIDATRTVARAHVEGLRDLLYAAECL